MEKSTTLGMTLGLFAVGYGMYLKGADPHALINPAAFLIIFAGTFAALLNAFPMKDIKRFGKLLKIIFTGYVMWHPFANKLKRISAEEVEMKKMVLEGALALQSGASSIAMEAKLQSFIPLSQRKSLRDEG